MLLAVDIGNSQTSFGIYSAESVTRIGGRLIHHWRFETRAATSPDLLAAFLHPLLTIASFKFEDIDRVALCSVVPSVDRIFLEFAERYLMKSRVFEIRASNRLAFDIAVDAPGEVGADRLANAQFAALNLKLPCVVVDFGTATTFDVVVCREKRPSYEGGVILPGVRIALEALSSRTSQLSSVNLRFPSRVIGKNTTHCIQSGLLYGYADMIDGLLARTERELGEPITVCLTGGLGVLFVDRLQRHSDYLPDLTLDGVRLITQANA